MWPTMVQSCQVLSTQTNQFQFHKKNKDYHFIGSLMNKCFKNLRINIWFDLPYEMSIKIFSKRHFILSSKFL